MHSQSRVNVKYFVGNTNISFNVMLHRLKQHQRINLSFMLISEIIFLPEFVTYCTKSECLKT
jgi:hypothetical protein